jgi:hypothetical protein
VENPAFPLEKTVAMINLDMIGRLRGNACSVSGTDSAKEWAEILEEAERDSPVMFRRFGRASGGSDHSSFLRKNIPVLFYMTGMHPEYHTPNDDAELCNPDGAVEILKVALKAALLVANRDERLTFQRITRTRARLGIITQPDGGGAGGLAIGGLSRGGGAGKAGLRAGDVILSVDGKPIKALPDLRAILQKHKPGDKVEVRYRRGDEEGRVTVTLGG